MPDELINADFAQRVVIATDELPWIASPAAGIERRLLDRIGGEVARATSLVKYIPGSAFPAHEHAMGEEFLVLEGVFSDEHGDYPEGTYVRNPPGSKHSPRTGPGCVIFVKLRQMPPAEKKRVVIDTNCTEWTPGLVPGHDVIHLHSDRETGEEVTLERLAPGVGLPQSAAETGEEIFVISGTLFDGADTHVKRSWIRNPAGSSDILHSKTGTVYWAKRGHLAQSGQ